MKKLMSLFIALGIICTASALNAEEAHDHGHQHQGGPKGGRLLEGTEPHAEFYVEKDRTAAVTFYDDQMKPVSVADQSVTVMAESAGNKSKLEFQKKGDVLVSSGSLPAAEDLNLVIQFKQDTQAKPKNFRFNLNENVCPECNRAEYACICEH